jgi:hypothetical protein
MAATADLQLGTQGNAKRGPHEKILAGHISGAEAGNTDGR